MRIAPRKMRMVVNLVRGKRVAVAKDILRFSQNRGAGILSKLLDAAVSSAKTLGQGDESNLTVLKIAVDEGPKLKRSRARAKGSAYPIQKKVSHITLVLDEVKDGKSAKESPRAAKTAPLSAAIKKDSVAIKTEKQKFKTVLAERKAARQERGVQRFFRRKAIG